MKPEDRVVFLERAITEMVLDHNLIKIETWTQAVPNGRTTFRLTYIPLGISVDGDNHEHRFSIAKAIALDELEAKVKEYYVGGKS